MSQILDENPRFAWVTNLGELILCEELVDELRAALAKQGIDIDPWPCRCALQAVRQVTQTITECEDIWPDPNDILDRLDRALRRRRILLERTTLRALLAAYLVQLETLDVAHIQLY